MCGSGRERLAGFSAAQIAAENATLKKFLSERLYNNSAIVADRERSVEALANYSNFIMNHPEAMPRSYCGAGAEPVPRHRVVCDYIAGHDRSHYLLRQLCGDRIGKIPS